MALQSTRQRLFAIVVFLTLTSTAVAAANATCYQPNGTAAFDNTGVMPYTPCNTTMANSMCCRKDSTDTCRSDGLCDSSWDGNIWRDFCTDPTWQAPECVKLCLGTDGADGSGNTGGTVLVTKCPNESYCCGVGSQADSCCVNGLGVWIAWNGQTTRVKPGATSRSSTILGAPTVTGTSSSISTTIPTAAAAPFQTSSAPGATVTKTTTESTTNTGAIAGGVVAGVVAAALIVGAAVWALRRRRNRPIEEKQTWAPPTVKRPALYVGEMEGSNAGRELPADSWAHEMGTEGISHK